MQDLIEHLTALLKKKKFKLVTAESCTGGLLAATLTHRSGASEIFERGFITYSNESKTELLNVAEDILKKQGAVSAETAEAMATGALQNSRANLAVSITGIAGPDGGTAEKPVGLVYFGYALKGGSVGAIEHKFQGSREEIQSHATMTALKHLISVLENPN
jgi:nicotinamide-nucleotide amidase